MGLHYSRLSMRKEFVSFSAWTMKDVRLAWRNATNDYPGMTLTMGNYKLLFGDDSRVAEKQFFTFDEHSKGRISVYLVFCTFVAMCKGSVDDKLRFYFGMFDIGNSGRDSLRREEVVMVMRLVMTGLCRVKKMTPPAFETYLDEVEDFCEAHKLSDMEEIGMELFLVWFKKDAKRVACIDTNVKNLARLGNLIARQRGLLDQLAKLVQELEDEGVEGLEWQVDLGKKAYKAYRKSLLKGGTGAGSRKKVKLNEEGMEVSASSSSEESSSSSESEDEMAALEDDAVRVVSRRPRPRGLASFFDWRSRAPDQLQEIVERASTAGTTHTYRGAKAEREAQLREERIRAGELEEEVPGLAEGGGGGDGDDGGDGGDREVADSAGAGAASPTKPAARGTAKGKGKGKGVSFGSGADTGDDSKGTEAEPQSKAASASASASGGDADTAGLQVLTTAAVPAAEDSLAMDAFFEEMERTQKAQKEGLDPEAAAAAAAAKATGDALLASLDFPYVRSLAQAYMAELTEQQLVHATEVLRRAARLPRRTVRWYYKRFADHVNEEMARLEAEAEKDEAKRLRREARRARRKAKADAEAASLTPGTTPGLTPIASPGTSKAGSRAASRPGSAGKDKGAGSRPSTAGTRASAASSHTTDTEGTRKGSDGDDSLASDETESSLDDEDLDKIAEKEKVRRQVAKDAAQAAARQAQTYIQQRFDTGLRRVFEHWLSRVYLYNSTTGFWARWLVAGRVYAAKVARLAGDALQPHRGSASSLRRRVARLRERANQAAARELARQEAHRARLKREAEEARLIEKFGSLAAAREHEAAAKAREQEAKDALAKRRAEAAAKGEVLPEDEGSDSEPEEEAAKTAEQIEEERRKANAEKTSRIVLDVDVDGGGHVYEQYVSAQIDEDIAPDPDLAPPLTAGDGVRAAVEARPTTVTTDPSAHSRPTTAGASALASAVGATAAGAGAGAGPRPGTGTLTSSRTGTGTEARDGSTLPPDTAGGGSTMTATSGAVTVTAPGTGTGTGTGTGDASAEGGRRRSGTGGRRSSVLGRRGLRVIGEAELGEAAIKHTVEATRQKMTDAEALEEEALVKAAQQKRAADEAAEEAEARAKRDALYGSKPQTRLQTSGTAGTAGTSVRFGGATPGTGTGTGTGTGINGAAAAGGSALDGVTERKGDDDAGSAAGSGSAGAAGDGGTRYTFLFSTHRRQAMPTPPVEIEGARRMSLPKARRKKKGKEEAAATQAEQLTKQLGVGSSPFGGLKSEAEMLALQERASKGSKKSLRKMLSKRPPRDKAKTRRAKSNKGIGSAKSTLKKKAAGANPYKSFIAIDLSAKKGVSLPQLREVATAVDAFLDMPLVKEKLLWLFDAKQIRVVTEAGISALRLFLFRREDTFARLFDWLGHPAKELLSGVNGGIKIRVDLGVSGDGLAALAAYRGWRRKLIHGRAGRKLTEFGRRAIFDLIDCFDSNLDESLTMGEFNRLQALNTPAITRYLADAPQPHPLAIPAPGSVAEHQAYLRTAYRDYEVIEQLFEALKGPTIVLKEEAEHAHRKRRMASVIADMLGQDNVKQRAEERKQAQIQEQLDAFAEKFFTRSPFLPALEDRHAFVEALPRHHVPVEAASGEVSRASIAGSYGRMIAGMVQVPGNDDFKGDKGHELAMDLREAGVGSLDHFLRVRVSGVAELSVAHMREVDEDLRLVLEDLKAEGVCIDGSDEPPPLEEILKVPKGSKVSAASAAAAGAASASAAAGAAAAAATHAQLPLGGGGGGQAATGESRAGAPKALAPGMTPGAMTHPHLGRELTAYEQWKVRTWRPEILPAPGAVQGSRFGSSGGDVAELYLFILQAVKGGQVRLAFDRLTDMIPRSWLPGWVSAPGKAVALWRKMQVLVADWHRRLLDRERDLERQARLAAKRKGRLRWQPARKGGSGDSGAPVVSDSEDEEAIRARPAEYFNGWAGQPVEDIIEAVNLEFGEVEGARRFTPADKKAKKKKRRRKRTPTEAEAATERLREIEEVEIAGRKLLDKARKYAQAPTRVAMGNADSEWAVSSVEFDALGFLTALVGKLGAGEGGDGGDATGVGGRGAAGAAAKAGVTVD